MRLVWTYLQTSHPDRYYREFQEEGLYCLLRRALEGRYFSELLVVIDAPTDKPLKEVSKNVYYRQVSGINNLIPELRPDDVILVRNGFRDWFQFLNKMNELRHWVLFYRAASNRHFWTMWDVVLEDVNPLINDGTYHDTKGRMYLPYYKPVHPGLFNQVDVPKEYDICIGASYIHRKKGQWRTIKGLAVLKQKYGYNPKCIMPGSPRSDLTPILKDIADNDLRVEIPDYLPKPLLASVFNKSIIYSHLATCGQNDRGVLEAIACGCPAMIGYPQFHAPFLYANDSPIVVCPNPDNPEQVADSLHDLLMYAQHEGSLYRNIIRAYYQQHTSINASLPTLQKLFEFFKQYPNADRQKLWEYYNSRKAD